MTDYQYDSYDNDYSYDQKKFNWNPLRLVSVVTANINCIKIALEESGDRFSKMVVDDHSPNGSGYTSASVKIVFAQYLECELYRRGWGISTCVNNDFKIALRVGRPLGPWLGDIIYNPKDPESKAHAIIQAARNLADMGFLRERPKMPNNHDPEVRY
jgi:hypothetical protein